MAGDSNSAAQREDSGTYHSGGGSTCCGPGQGLACCTADAGLWGYDYAPDGAVIVVGDVAEMAGGTVPANCFRYGGILGACAGDGEQFDGKDACTLCCPGLTPVIKAVAGGGDAGDAGPSCVPAVPVSLFTCMPCGNGVCDTEENHCTCPGDCP